MKTIAWSMRPVLYSRDGSSLWLVVPLRLRMLLSWHLLGLSPLTVLAMLSWLLTNLSLGLSLLPFRVVLWCAVSLVAVPLRATGGAEPHWAASFMARASSTHFVEMQPRSWDQSDTSTRPYTLDQFG